MNGNTYRFSQVAKALGRSEAVLRNWFTRSKVELGSAQRSGGGWRSFDDDDVAILAVANELILIGADVSEAVNAAMTGYAMIQGHFLYAARINGVWRVEAEEALLAAWDVNNPPASILTINVTQCWAAVRRRLLSDA